MHGPLRRRTLKLEAWSVEPIPVWPYSMPGPTRLIAISQVHCIDDHALPLVPYNGVTIPRSLVETQSEPLLNCVHQSPYFGTFPELWISEVLKHCHCYILLFASLLRLGVSVLDPIARTNLSKPDQVLLLRSRTHPPYVPKRHAAPRPPSMPVTVQCEYATKMSILSDTSVSSLSLDNVATIYD